MGLRVAAGVASPVEVQVLTDAPRILGGGLVTYAKLTMAQWVRKFGGPWSHLPAEPVAPAPPLGELRPDRPASTDDGSGIVLADPAREPAPRGRERLRNRSLGRG